MRGAVPLIQNTEREEAMVMLSLVILDKGQVQPSPQQQVYGRTAHNDTAE